MINCPIQTQVKLLQEEPSSFLREHHIPNGAFKTPIIKQVLID
jgi:hypothetical protein